MTTCTQQYQWLAWFMSGHRCTNTNAPARGGGEHGGPWSRQRVTCSETKCSEQKADAAWRPSFSRSRCHVLKATTVSRWSLFAPDTGAASLARAA